MQKVRVFGTDSTGQVRARLIEILYDRVANHKDKFIAPILHQEMKGMEVKKNGRVEHSQNTHDDQVFSYLMALYVWYDGKNLAENFHLFKNSIRTDTDIDIEALEIDDSLEPKETIDVERLTYESNDKLIEDLEFVESNSKLITTATLKEEYAEQKIVMRDIIFANDKGAREAYAKQTGVDPSMYMNPSVSNTVYIPDYIFTSFNDDDDGQEEQYSYVQGNLKNWWDQS